MPGKTVYDPQLQAMAAAEQAVAQIVKAAAALDDADERAEVLAFAERRLRRVASLNGQQP